MESSESTKILIDSCRVFLKYAKREQVDGMLMLTGWSDTQCDKPMSSLLEHINTDFKIPRRRRQQKRRKRKTFRLAKHQLGMCIMLFCRVSLPSLHIYDVKLRNFTLYGGREHETTMFSFFCEVRYSPLEFHS